MTRETTRTGANLSGLLSLGGLLLAWQLTIDAGLIGLQYLPAPAEIVVAGVANAGQLLVATAHTIGVALIAWVVALVIGVAAGVLLGAWGPAHQLFMASVDVFRTLPVVAFVPIAVLALGLSATMEITVAAWAAVWPILVNTIGGVQAVPSKLHEVAAVLRLGPARRLWSIVLPAAAPMILVGARLGLSFALVITVVAEMIGNPAGLGHQVIRMQQALRPDAMFAAVIIIGLLGVGLNAALLGLTGRAAPGIFGRGSAT